MSRNLLSVMAIIAAGSLFIGRKKLFGTKETLIQRAVLKSILITLRKRFYSTLREISFIVKHLKVHQGFSNNKITEILMQNGSSAERKLSAIQEMVLLEYKIQKRLDFQYSCVYYASNDIQIKILLDNLKLEMKMALDGNLLSFNDPLPMIQNQEAIQIYKQIITRRLRLIQKKYTQFQNQTQDNFLNKSIQKQMITKTILLEIEIEQFLIMKGIKDQQNKQPCQKILMSILQKKCLQNSFFQKQMHQLQQQLQYGMYIKYFSYQKQQQNICQRGQFLNQQFQCLIRQKQKQMNDSLSFYFEQQQRKQVFIHAQ